MRLMTARTHAHRRGLTLAECLMASAILAVVVLAVAQAIGTGQEQTFQAIEEQRGQMLGAALLEEVLALPYAPDGVITGRGGRTQISEFHGFKEAAGTLKDAAGQTYPNEFQKFSRSVTVTAASLTLPGQSATAGLNVAVTVTDAKGAALTTQRFVPQP